MRKQFAKPNKPRPSPPLASLAGNFANGSFGKAVVRPEGDALTMELQATGAQFKLEPWDGDVFAVRVIPNGRFAAMAENLGNDPNGLARSQATPPASPPYCASPLMTDRRTISDAKRSKVAPLHEEKLTQTRSR